MNANALALLAAAALIAAPAYAQSGNTDTSSQDNAGKPDETRVEKRTEKKALSQDDLVQKIGIQRMRPNDQRGIHMFETPKRDAVPFAGVAVEFGAAFTQQFQGLQHENAAVALTPTGSPATTNSNQLMEIGRGFNNAVANAYINAQLAPGIRVAMTGYLSSRHHQETWVKDGFLLIDESPIDFAPLNALMNYVTVKAGHFEINYGDTHFRRTDNGNAMYNPFVGNQLLDAFTTEIGGEVYFRNDMGLIAMVSGLAGESRGMVIKPSDRSIAWVSKLGFDRQISRDLRVRLTGSTFNQPSSTNNTLFSGDRGGSRYYMVLENATATETAQFTSGTFNPGFGDKLRSMSVNPFIKFRGLEFFGDWTDAQGRRSNETTNRDVTQQSVEGIYRFGANERFFVGARHNTVEGTLALTRPASNLGALLSVRQDVDVTRQQLSGGWFITPAIMVKAEYMTQKYNDFPTWDIRHKGKFDGFVVEGVVAF
jgi:hypothetical protein